MIDPVTGAARNTISFTSLSLVRALVKDGNGKALPNTVVRFSASDEAAITFSPAATALTDENGVASVNLGPARLSTAGAYAISGSVQVGESAFTGSTSVAVGASQVALGDLAPGISPLSAYGTTVFSVSVSGVPTSTLVQVRFTSACAAQNPPRATITPMVSTVNGIARATYVDKGCGSQDLVTATVEGTSVVRAATLPVLSPSVANIQFASASPMVIALRGTGGTQGPGTGVRFPEISTVRFQVVDEAGVPVATPTNVTLSLSNDTGGILIDQLPGPVVKQTDANGFVEVQVQSGTLPTPVWVIASITTATRTVTTNSVQLAVSTGQPIQSRFSTSFEVLNCEGWSYDGKCGSVGVIAADAMGNPVPDGTAISFIADHGMVEANCQTGVITGRPLPGGDSPGEDSPGRCRVSVFSQGTRPSDGRVGVVAYAVGEEHYEDWNSNNRYDVGEAFYDMGYLFIDRNQSGAYEAGERFVPFLTAQSGACASNSLPAVRTASVPGTCDGVWGRAHVRSGGVIVFSGSVPYFRTSPVFGSPNISNIPTSYSLGAACSAVVGFWLQDLNGNPMPEGTVVSADTGGAFKLSTSSEPTRVPNTNARGGTYHAFAISGRDPVSGECVGSGAVRIRTQTPRGIISDIFVNVGA
ncbi:Ig-like domain-containing protein [Quisquiliibacterium transsilvanicum]|uniref:Ig-like domain-containing protein n=1 Tax=Quisquiliibacterium transsilvanicum TaxID=1549638 RepID=UPI001C85DC46